MTMGVKSHRAQGEHLCSASNLQLKGPKRKPELCDVKGGPVYHLDEKTSVGFSASLQQPKAEMRPKIPGHYPVILPS